MQVHEEQNQRSAQQTVWWRAELPMHVRRGRWSVAVGWCSTGHIACMCTRAAPPVLGQSNRLMPQGDRSGVTGPLGWTPEALDYCRRRLPLKLWLSRTGMALGDN